MMRYFIKHYTQYFKGVQRQCYFSTDYKKLLFAFLLRLFLQLDTEVAAYWHSGVAAGDFVITRVSTACFSPTSGLLLPSLPGWLLRHDYWPSNIHTHAHILPPALPRDDRFKQSPLLELNSQKSRCCTKARRLLGDSSRGAEKMGSCWELCERGS